MKFSIILPTYNRAGFLPQAIVSVLAQTYCNWELLVIDDGSTDNTREVVNHFISKDVRVKYFYQKNQERSAARNHGIEKSSGEWICFLDSDDYFLENHLEVLQKNIILHQEIKFFLTGIRINTEGNVQEKAFLNFSSTHGFKEIMEDFILMNTVCLNFMLLKENKFDNRFSIWEDTHLWLRIAEHYRIYQIKVYTCVQNVHAENSVKISFRNVDLKKVNQYILAISDVEMKICNFSKIINTKLYKDSKYKMFLYSARQNKQFIVANMLWFMAIRNRVSVDLILEFPKIYLNKMGVGVHYG